MKRTCQVHRNHCQAYGQCGSTNGRPAYPDDRQTNCGNHMATDERPRLRWGGFWRTQD